MANAHVRLISAFESLCTSVHSNSLKNNWIFLLWFQFLGIGLFFKVAGFGFKLWAFLHPGRGEKSLLNIKGNPMCFFQKVP